MNPAPGSEINILPMIAGGIDTVAALLLTAIVFKSLWMVRQDYPQLNPARTALAEGSIQALGIFLGATLIKSIALMSWHQIGLAFCLATLRTLLKKTMQFQLRHPA